MEKDLFKFLNGEKNVVKGNFIISREKAGKGAEHIQIRPENSERNIFSFWHNTDSRNKTDQPKHTGGRKPYVMLMIKEISELRKKGIPNIEELIGFLICLSDYVDWGTGKLLHKRSKKPFKYKDFSNTFSFGNRKLNRILNELKEHDLLYKAEEGYFISRRFIRKGKTK